MWPSRSRQHHYARNPPSESHYTYQVYIGPTAVHGDAASHSSIASITQRQTPSCADMPHADHALAHAAPAFPGAGSCLERAQHHSAMPLAPRQVSELCTFRLAQIHSANKPAASQARAVQAHTASPLDGLAQRTPGQPRHPGDWADPCVALHRAPRHGGRRRSLSRSPGTFAEFPCLADRAAGHCPPRLTHIASRHCRRPQWQGRSIPTHLHARPPPALCTSVRGAPPTEYARVTPRKVGVLAWCDLASPRLPCPLGISPSSSHISPLVSRLVPRLV